LVLWAVEILQSAPGNRPDFFLSRKNFFRHYNKHLVDRACSFRIGEYRSLRLRLCSTEKKYSANIPISEPHARSITVLCIFKAKCIKWPDPEKGLFM
jgi:hypothetical protein